MARILLGITGGIAAYKACELVRLFVRAGHEVLPLPTPGVERFVAPETFYALARTSPPARSLSASRTRGRARDRATDREHAREARARPCRQHPHGGRACASRPARSRTGHEHADVDALGHAGKRRHPPEPRRDCRRAGRGRACRGRGGGRPDGGAERDRPGRRNGARERLSSGRSEQRARREARARDRRWDTRAPRRRSFPREPLLGTDGCRPGCGGVPPRRRRDASGREPRRLRAAGGRARRDAHRRRRGARDKHPRRLGRRRRHGRRCRGLPSRRSAERQAAEGRGAVDGGARADGRRARRTRRARAERTAARGLRGGGGPRPVSSGSGRCSTARTSISSSTTT